MRFWDSSAVVPLLVQQRASAQAETWLGEDRAMALWAFTAVEVTSGLWRLVREGAVSESVALGADSRAEQLVAASHLVVDMDAVASSARRLLRVHGLRAADALQLAAALLWSAGRAQGRTLHTLDERLAIAARREGFSVP